MKRYDRLIFLSNSDTLRGPMAAGILRGKYLLGDLQVDSRGLVVLFPEPVNAKAQAVAKSHGQDLSAHQASVLLESDFDERTLILTLDTESQRKVFETYENAVNVFLLTSFVGSTEELVNPYGRDLKDYGECYEALEALITKLVVLLNEEELLC